MAETSVFCISAIAEAYFGAEMLFFDVSALASAYFGAEMHYFDASAIFFGCQGRGGG
ncbi:hypothetical protein [Paenibacillus marinisediminis]